jgi:hypothetical protein
MPVTTKTRAQLVTRAAQKGMLIAAGQSLEAEDQALIDAAVDGVLADLNARNIVTVADESAIEIELFEWLADILYETSAPDFGKPRDYDKILFAEQRLNAINMARPTYEPLEVDHF